MAGRQTVTATATHAGPAPGHPPGEAGTTTERFCAVRASGAAQDPIGSGGAVTRLLFVETPTPWGEDYYTADPNGGLRQRIRAVQRDYIERLRTAGEFERTFATGYPALCGIAPDPEWSRPGERRVLLAARPSGPFARFRVDEYLFPGDDPQVVALAGAYFNAPEEIARFAPYRSGAPPQREFFVCTHGHVDVCCARFGVPLYRQARAAYPTVRAWRTTHFGGHRFAPTAWELPEGYKWGFLDAAATDQVLRRSGHPADLAGKLRGWSGVVTQVQPLDREGLRRYGWDWLDARRTGEVLEADDAAGRWRVRLRFELPGSPARSGTLEGIVAVARELPDTGCGPKLGQYERTSREYALESCTVAPDRPTA